MSTISKPSGHKPEHATRPPSPSADSRSFWILLGFAALVYLIIALIITFPLILDFNGSIFALPGDPFGALYSLWLSVREPVNFAFPHAPVLVATGAVLTRLFGEVAAYNLMLLSGFALTGAAGFALTYFLTRRVSAAFLTGLILVIAPYHVGRALQHVGLANIHWLLFLLLALLWFDKRPTVLRGLVFAFSFALTMLDSYLYGIFAVLILVFFSIWRISLWLLQKDRKPWGLDQWGALALSLMLGFSLIIPALSPFLETLVGRTNTGVELVRDSTSQSELAAFSAKGFAYVVPPPNNILFGDFAKPIYARHEAAGTNITELSLYLGIVTIVLAVIGIVGVQRKPLVDLNARHWASFWVLLAAVGLYFSFAPSLKILGIEVATPGVLLYESFPLLRVYSRFGLLTLIATTMLAGYGIAWIVAHIHDRKRRWALVGVLGVLITSELLSLPKARTIAVDAEAMPAVYAWLASQEASAVGQIAEYPLLPPEEPDGYTYQLWARFHDHRSINLDYAQSGDSDERAQLADLNRADTLPRLKAKGVTHILIHTEKYASEKVAKYPLELHEGKPVYFPVDDTAVALVGTFGETLVYAIK